MLSRLKILIVPLLFGMIIVGCEKDGPMEDAGEAIDEAVEDAGEAIEDAQEKVEDAVEEQQEK